MSKKKKKTEPIAFGFSPKQPKSLSPIPIVAGVIKHIIVTSASTERDYNG